MKIVDSMQKHRCGQQVISIYNRLGKFDLDGGAVFRRCSVYRPSYTGPSSVWTTNISVIPGASLKNRVCGVPGDPIRATVNQTKMDGTTMLHKIMGLGL